ncbi:MFS transporter [Sphingorhabdus sp.]|uniref:MFS transporter n=1 Tax=Sphingorhabdus sp. TaxID=1902408 RepID=UPI0035AE9E49
MTGRSTKGLAKRRHRLGLASWCLYDWANSAFPTIITTFVFSVYFTQMVAENPVQGSAQWSYSVAGAALIVAMGAPALGAIADRMGRRKPWLLSFTILTMICTAGLWWIKPSPQFAIPALLLYAAGAASFGFAMIFYDAMLRSIAPPGHIGRLSGWGWSLGYVGGLLCLIIALFVFLRAGPPPFGLSQAEDEPVRATALLVVLWFAIFAVPIFVFTPDRRATGTTLHQAVKGGASGLVQSLRAIFRHRGMARFLIAHMFYTNGINTLFSFGGIYAAGTFGLSLDQVLYFGILLNVTAALGAAAFSWLDDGVGSKITILLALCGLSVLGLALVLIESQTWFFVLGSLLGLFVGPAQSAGRSMMARLAPQAFETQAFGLYELSGKVTIFAGPLVLGLATSLFQSQRIGMSTILIFFVLGALILLRVQEPDTPPPTGSGAARPN